MFLLTSFLRDDNSDPTIPYNHSPPHEQHVIRQEPGSFVPASIYMQKVGGLGAEKSEAPLQALARSLGLDVCRLSFPLRTHL
ncbi:hypothetical protein RHMOL_Rhmol07G0238500 [Rhododendron molle]|uniref:Uncharacterized protein n=1 Tax=Rhododendron molle TaxID=49168 RepID=A0ACC0N654_RHOML|nr:hypothetical protein RHMOL_Rhmol07G0238500 [Rhododendron molle]